MEDNIIVPLVKIPTRELAEELVKKLALSGNVILSKHARMRMKERDITMPQILNCLCKGKVIEIPYRSNSHDGGYLVTMEKGTAGEWLKVVVCLKYNRKVLVITACN